MEPLLVNYREQADRFFRAYRKRSFVTFYNYAHYIRTILAERNTSCLQPYRNNQENWYSEILDFSEGFLILASRDRLAAKNKVVEWIATTESSGNSIQVMLAALRSLCNFAEVELGWKNIRSIAPKPSIPDIPAPPREAIIKAFQLADLRGKVLIGILLGAPRVGFFEWQENERKYFPRIGDLKEIQMEGKIIGELTIYHGSKDQYITWLTDEAMHFWHMYLDYRKNIGREVLTDMSPLVRKRFDPEQPNVARPVTDDDVQRYFNDLWRRCNYPSKREVERLKLNVTPRDWQGVHGFRKYAEIQLETAGNMKHEDAERILGHNTKRYRKPVLAYLRSEWFRCMPSLYISNEFALESKVKEVEKEMQNKENNWFVQAKRFEEQLEKLKAVDRLRWEFHNEKNPAKQHELAKKITDLMNN